MNTKQVNFQESPCLSALPELRCVNKAWNPLWLTTPFLSALSFFSPSWLKSQHTKLRWTLRLPGEDCREELSPLCECEWRQWELCWGGKPSDQVVVIHKDEIWSTRHQQVNYEGWGQFRERFFVILWERRLWVNQWVHFGRFFFLIKIIKHVLSKEKSNQKKKMKQRWHFQVMLSLVKTQIDPVHCGGKVWT